MTVYLLTISDALIGSECQVLGVYDSQEAAAVAKAHYERDRTRPDGSVYNHRADIEAWKAQSVDEATRQAAAGNP